MGLRWDWTAKEARGVAPAKGVSRLDPFRSLFLVPARFDRERRQLLWWRRTFLYVCRSIFTTLRRALSAYLPCGPLPSAKLPFVPDPFFRTPFASPTPFPFEPIRNVLQYTVFWLANYNRARNDALSQRDRSPCRRPTPPPPPWEPPQPERRHQRRHQRQQPGQRRQQRPRGWRASP